MKVLHFQHNGAGVVISDGLKKIGVESVVASTAPHPFGFKEDYLIERPEDLKGLGDFDILHSHSEVKLPTEITQLYSGRLVQHYHDSMMGRLESFSPLKTAILGKNRFKLYDDAMNFVSTPNVLECIDDATFVPLPVDTEEFRLDRASGEAFTIGFNASALDKRKVRFLVNGEITQAVQSLERKGVQVVIKPQPTNINHNQMREVYWKHIDVWVDRFGLDFYGFSSVEAAACGIPVVCQIGEKESKFVPTCPFVNTAREKLVDTLVNRSFLDKKLKKAHRDFAVEVHDHVVVAKLCKSKYEKLLKVN